MNTLKLIGMVPLVMLAATSFGQGSDDKAVPRSSGSGSSASAGSRHSGGGSSSSSSAGQNSQGSGDRNQASAPSGRSQANSSARDAARRRPAPGTGTGSRDRFGNNRGRYYGSPYSNYYYNPYAYSWGYPRSYGLYGYGYGYYDYGYSYGDYYGYYPSSYYRSYRYRSGNVAQLRTLVEPSKARVYVDGYYAGIVDDFDGLFQRLNVSPGRHDITFKLEGYNSHTFAVYANRDQTLKIRWDMARGSGETRDSSGAEFAQGSDRDEDLDRDMDRDRDMSMDRDRDPGPDRTESAREVDSDRRYEAPSRTPGRGELQLDVQPGDASVYVDGEFYGKASQVTRLELTAGRHRVEVVRPGYKTVEQEVDIDRDPARITVRLDRR